MQRVRVLLGTALVMMCLFGGGIGGRLLAQSCKPCYNEVSDGGIGGKYSSNECFVGVCQNATSPSECYKESCSACKWNPKKRTGCQEGVNYACPAAGNCPGGKPVEHWMCHNLCRC